METTLPGLKGDSEPIDVVIFASYRAVVPHFETELDIAQQHLDRGDRVTLVQCEGALPNCEFNPNKDPDVCKNCAGRRQMGIEMLDGDVNVIRFVEPPLPENLQLEFDSVDELTGYHWKGFDIGYAALSSLVSFCRDPDPDLKQHQPMLNQLMVAAWHTYEESIRLLQLHLFDRAYVYNGRFAAMRSTLRACQQLGVDCFLHERGCDGAHFELLKNHLPHDLSKIEQAIRDAWESTDAAKRTTIGASWFTERVDRVEKVWHSFTKNQQRELLPENWDAAKKNVTIFCSSDDEFVAIGDAWKNDLYPNQVDAIESIVRDMQIREPEIRFYLRMHPNLSGVDNARCKQMLHMSYPNLTVIAPEAKIDTYRLIRESESVISFGSSVGAEAVFWGTPSILLGPCFYQNLGGVYRAHSHEQTLELIGKPLEPGEKTGVLMYGLWFQTRGFPHRYFKATGLFDGRFKSQTIYARPPQKSPRLLQRIKGSVRRLLGRK